MINDETLSSIPIAHDYFLSFFFSLIKTKYELRLVIAPSRFNQSSGGGMRQRYKRERTVCISYQCNEIKYHADCAAGHAACLQPILSRGDMLELFLKARSHRVRRSCPSSYMLAIGPRARSRSSFCGCRALIWAQSVGRLVSPYTLATIKKLTSCHLNHVLQYFCRAECENGPDIDCCAIYAPVGLISLNPD